MKIPFDFGRYALLFLNVFWVFNWIKRRWWNKKKIISSTEAHHTFISRHIFITIRWAINVMMSVVWILYLCYTCPNGYHLSERLPFVHLWLNTSINWFWNVWTNILQIFKSKLWFNVNPFRLSFRITLWLSLYFVFIESQSPWVQFFCWVYSTKHFLQWKKNFI